jgi:Sulfotransferase family
MGLIEKLQGALRKKLKISLAHLKGEIPQRGPDFFIVGASRAGTTFLHHMLASHPDIFMPQAKELMYFNHNGRYQPDLNGYMGMFYGYRHEKLIGEATPLYMEAGTFYGVNGKIKFRQQGSTMQRIYKSLPHAKIIVSLRSPMTRIISMYTKNRFQGKISTSLSEEIHNELSGGSRLNLLYRNRYDIHLENIFDYFPRSNVKIIFFEEWTKNIKSGMKDICDFLWVPDMESWPDLPEKNKNKSSKYKNDRTSGSTDTNVVIDSDLRQLISKELFMVYEYVEKIIGRKVPWESMEK